MKNLFLTFALLFSAVVFAQEPVLDSIEIYTPMPNPILVETMYDFENFYTELTALSDKTGEMRFVIKYYYKETADGPQKTDVRVLARNKPQ